MLPGGVKGEGENSKRALAHNPSLAGRKSCGRYRCAAGNYRLYSERVYVFGAFTIAFERSLANYGLYRSDGKMWRSAAAGCEKIFFNLKPAVFDASPLRGRIC